MKNGHFWNVQFSFFQKSLEKAIFVTEKKISVRFLKKILKICYGNFFLKFWGFFIWKRKKSQMETKKSPHDKKNNYIKNVKL